MNFWAIFRQTVFLGILGIFLISCSAGIQQVTTAQADSLQVAPKIPDKNAVVVLLTGEISRSWVERVQPYFKNPQYTTIILWIESGGGGASTAQLVSHDLEVLKKKYKKTLFIFSEYVLASGAYFIACTGEEIVTAPTAVVGAIGVYVDRIDVSKNFDHQGIKHNYIASHPNKLFGIPAVPMTVEEYIFWQIFVTNKYHIFLGYVWSNRYESITNAYIARDTLTAHLPIRQQWAEAFKYFQKSVATGMMYDAFSAYESGLVDRVLYFDVYIHFLQQNGYTIYNTSDEVITDLYTDPEENKSNKGIHRFSTREKND